ncbi:MAG: hypothetical protein IKI92_06025 [Anaerotignum sp.]|nr:hypothetical protein [Anaerotignum sp.]
MKRKTIILLAVLIATGLFLQQLCPDVSASETRDMYGGINIMKTDVLGKGLAGSCFQIAREATLEEMRDSSVTKRLLKAGAETMTVVYISFWDSRDMEGEKVMEAVTASDGSAAMYGLPYGTYYLVESKAPDGDDKMKAPIRVTVNKYSHLKSDDDIRDDEDTVIDNTIHIFTIRYNLPDTGKASSSMISVALTGLTISLGALLCLIRIRRKCLL